MFGRNTAHMYGWPPHHHHPPNPQRSYVASKPCNIYFLMNQYKMFGRNTAHMYGWHPSPPTYTLHQYPPNPQRSYVVSKPCNIYLFPFGIIIQTFSELLNDNLSICLSNHLIMALLLCTLCQTTENIMILRYITLCVLFALRLFCDWMKYA